MAHVAGWGKRRRPACGAFDEQLRAAVWPAESEETFGAGQGSMVARKLAVRMYWIACGKNKPYAATVTAQRPVARNAGQPEVIPWSQVETDRLSGPPCLPEPSGSSEAANHGRRNRPEEMDGGATESTRVIPRNEFGSWQKTLLEKIKNARATAPRGATPYLCGLT